VPLLMGGSFAPSRLGRRLTLWCRGAGPHLAGNFLALPRRERLLQFSLWLFLPHRSPVSFGAFHAFFD